MANWVKLVPSYLVGFCQILHLSYSVLSDSSILIDRLILRNMPMFLNIISRFTSY